MQGDERERLIAVYEDTRALSCRFPAVTSTLVRLRELPETEESSAPVHVGLVACDTLDLALRIPAGVGKPLVLNMASERAPGGGVKRGCDTQEECIFRRTNACATYLAEWYPLREECVYSPDIAILKDSDYNRLADTRSIAMVGLPAVRKPKLHPDDPTRYLEDETRLQMRFRINALFELAILHNHTTLILGALGCGAYGHPPEEVAPLFRAAIERYGGHFASIHFAIKGADRNLRVFRKVFGK